MRPGFILLRAAGPRVPLIKFLGKRNIPKSPPPQEPAIAEPHPHPASPSHSLPDSFIAYRSKAQQHGPLAGHGRPSSDSSASSTNSSYGAWGEHSGHDLGSVSPGKNEVWDRSELPGRFGRLKWTGEEIEAVELGGAGLPVGSGGA